MYDKLLKMTFGTHPLRNFPKVQGLLSPVSPVGTEHVPADGVGHGAALRVLAPQRVHVRPHRHILEYSEVYFRGVKESKVLII